MRAPLCLPCRARPAYRNAGPRAARLCHERRDRGPLVYTARDDGKERLRSAQARPAVSPDSRWIAYITVPESSRDLEELSRCRSAAVRGGSHARPLRDRPPLLAELGPPRGDPARAAGAALRHRGGHDVDTARGHIRGYSFSPDGTHSPSGWATGLSVGAPTDIYVAPSTAPWSAAASPPRATRSTRSGGRRSRVRPPAPPERPPAGLQPLGDGCRGGRGAPALTR